MHAMGLSEQPGAGVTVRLRGPYRDVSESWALRGTFVSKAFAAERETSGRSAGGDLCLQHGNQK